MADKTVEVKKEEVDKIKEKIQEDFDLSSVEESIKKNEIEFEHGGVAHKVRKPTYKERQEL